jgi:H+/gluconate symporter-like permease
MNLLYELIVLLAGIVIIILLTAKYYVNAFFALIIACFTGFIVGLPVFCDSDFIVLNGLNKSLSRKTGISVVILSISLATGLYAVHCLIVQNFPLRIVRQYLFFCL